MFRIIIPTIVILGAIGSFFAYTSPAYKDIKSVKADIASYNNALSNSKKVQLARKDLTDRYNAISIDDQKKLEKVLPDSIDNIRLILEIQKISEQYPGATLKNIKFGSISSTPTSPGQIAQISTASLSAQNKSYNQAEMEFTLTSSYSNFLKFLQDIEKSLRVIDVKSITFTSNEQAGFSVTPIPADVYNFNFKISTYWLKN